MTTGSGGAVGWATTSAHRALSALTPGHRANSTIEREA